MSKELYCDKRALNDFEKAKNDLSDQTFGQFT